MRVRESRPKLERLERERQVLASIRNNYWSGTAEVNARCGHLTDRFEGGRSGRNRTLDNVLRRLKAQGFILSEPKRSSWIVTTTGLEWLRKVEADRAREPGREVTP